MKIIFSSVSRLILSYIKYILAITMISTIGTSAIADTNESIYLNCENNYARITDHYVSSNYNVRTRKFLDHNKIKSYTENFITFKISEFSNNRLNRNNGNWLWGKNILRTCVKIEFKDLPTENTGGKLF
jgi:hypothetical protein